MFQVTVKDKYGNIMNVLLFEDEYDAWAALDIAQAKFNAELLNLEDNDD